MILQHFHFCESRWRFHAPAGLLRGVTFQLRFAHTPQESVDGVENTGAPIGVVALGLKYGPRLGYRHVGIFGGHVYDLIPSFLGVGIVLFVFIAPCRS